MNKSKIIDLPKIEDTRGNLSIIEEENNIPFKIERTYWIYDVPGGQIRGGHAFKKQQEFIVALSGSFDVIIDDGKAKQIFFEFVRSSRIKVSLLHQFGETRVFAHEIIKWVDLHTQHTARAGTLFQGHPDFCYCRLGITSGCINLAQVFSADSEIGQ